MADRKALQAEMISGHSGASPGLGMQRDLEVCKLVDTTTCIGCKACEVACAEWNDMPFTPTTFDNTYQTMRRRAGISGTSSSSTSTRIRWHDPVADAQGPVHALRRSGLPGGLSGGRRHRQICQRIVDFNQENCIGCEFCVSGCPFEIPRFNPMTKKVYKCTLCSDRVGEGLEPACIKACPTGCLKFGSKDDMKYIAEERAKQLRDNFGWQNAGVYDPQSVGGTHVIYVLHDATDPNATACRRTRPSPGVIRCGSGCSSPCSARSRCSVFSA